MKVESPGWEFLARIYYQGVIEFGQDAYNAAQIKATNYAIGTRR